MSVALQWDQVDDTINDQMKHVFETDKNGTAAIFYRSCLKGTSSIDSWNMLTPWMDLSENITSNASFVDAMIEIQNADMSLFWTWSVDIDTWNKHRYALFMKGVNTMVSTGDYKS